MGCVTTVLMRPRQHNYCLWLAVSIACALRIGGSRHRLQASGANNLSWWPLHISCGLLFEATIGADHPTASLGNLLPGEWHESPGPLGGAPGLFHLKTYPVHNRLPRARDGRMPKAARPAGQRY